MTLETILSIERCTTLDGGSKLARFRDCLLVGLHNPEDRDHKGDNGEHDESAISCFLNRIGARVEDI